MAGRCASARVFPYAALRMSTAPQTAPAAGWDSKLKGCARRVHLATLDVLGPHPSPLPQIPAQGLAALWVSTFPEPGQLQHELKHTRPSSP
jgi:hypothetical protein